MGLICTTCGLTLDNISFGYKIILKSYNTGCIFFTSVYYICKFQSTILHYKIHKMWLLLLILTMANFELCDHITLFSYSLWIFFMFLLFFIIYKTAKHYKSIYICIITKCPHETPFGPTVSYFLVSAVRLTIFIQSTE